MPAVKERSDDEDGARSGRERPIHFKNAMTEVGFVSVVLPTLLAVWNSWSRIPKEFASNLDTDANTHDYSELQPVYQ
jgi:ABC-type nickel/cobalt efflux system permease component RcnA